MTKKTSILFLSVNSTTLCRWLSSCLDWVIHIPCRWLCRHALIGSSAYHLAGYVVMPLPGSSTYHNGGYAVMPLSGHPHTMSSVMSSCLCLVIHIPCRWLCRHALVHPHTTSLVVVITVLIAFFSSLLALVALQTRVSGARGLVSRNEFFFGTRDQAHAPPKTTHHYLPSAWLLLICVENFVLSIVPCRTYSGVSQYLFSAVIRSCRYDPISCSHLIELFLAARLLHNPISYFP